MDRRLADGKDPLMRAFESRNMDMASLILEADLEQNFLHKDGLTADMARSYQSKERGMSCCYKLRDFFLLFASIIHVVVPITDTKDSSKLSFNSGIDETAEFRMILCFFQTLKRFCSACLRHREVLKAASLGLRKQQQAHQGQNRPRNDKRS